MHDPTSGSSEESQRGVRGITLFVCLTLTKYYEITEEKYARTNGCDQLEIKTVSAEAAELFLHLEVFVCRILVSVDLHVRDMPLLGCGRLIDLDETLPEITMSCCNLDLYALTTIA